MPGLRTYLTDTANWTKDDEERLLASCGDAVERAAGDYLAREPQPVEAIFDYLYERLPADLTTQRAAAAAWATRDGRAGR